jgi:hypothetical protein
MRACCRPDDCTRPPNGWRQPRAGGLVLLFPSWKAVYHIWKRKMPPIPASRLHAVLGARFANAWLKGDTQVSYLPLSHGS